MPTGIGIIGCGNIAPIYVQNLQAFDQTEVVALADLDVSRAQQRASEHGIAIATDVETLLRTPEVDIVLNLTVPLAHGDVAMQALTAGKHVYNEKPLAVGWDESRTLVNDAADRGLSVGCAPDTVLGAGIQTCREVIDSGEIGEIVGAQAFMMCPGHESWHPDPGFYYQVGGGPMFDMGPYYLSALVTLIGPVQSVASLTRVTRPVRTITSAPKKGQTIDVETPTHISSLLHMASGAIVHITTSFDVVAHTLPHIEVYGTRGSLSVPDPNGFGGPVRVRRSDGSDWVEVPVTRPYQQNSRGLGVLDMALALKEGRPARADGALALHVCEVMHASLKAADKGQTLKLETTCERPLPMPREAL